MKMRTLDRLQISRKDTLAFVGAESVRLKKDEILVWVSVTNENVVELTQATPRFPAILDTGHTHNFAIQNQHLIRWAGIDAKTLRPLGHIRHTGTRMPLFSLRLWLHPNQPGKMAVSEDDALFLNLPDGLVVYPDGANYPRLPLLGMRAILSNNLHVAVDGEHASVTVRTPDWRTRVLTWLA
jgi:hypothetical protein